MKKYVKSSRLFLKIESHHQNQKNGYVESILALRCVQCIPMYLSLVLGRLSVAGLWGL